MRAVVIVVVAACASRAPQATPHKASPAIDAGMKTTIDAGVSTDAHPWHADDFAPALAPIVCDHAIRCGELAPSERDRCLKDGPVELYEMLHHVPTFYDFHEAVKAGRLVEDPGKLGACLDAARAASCADRDWLWACWQKNHFASVPIVYAPALAPGKACRSAAECKGGYCASQGNKWDGCGGKCVAYSQEGGTCDDYERKGACDDDHYCDNGHCKRSDDVGAACVPFRNCKRELFCQGYVGPKDGDEWHAPVREKLGTCERRGAVGDACRLFGDYAYDCAFGLWCDGSVSPPVCRAPLADGADCPWPHSCGEGATCRGVIAYGPSGVDTQPTKVTRHGVCTHVVDLGGACDPTAVETEKGCAAYDVCDPSTKKCVLAGAAGEKCDSDTAHCLPGLYCDAWTNTCQPQRGANESCKPYPPAGGIDPCMVGSCDRSAKKCAQDCD
jgi:hypothetical protein